MGKDPISLEIVLSISFALKYNSTYEKVVDLLQKRLNYTFVHVNDDYVFNARLDKKKNIVVNAFFKKHGDRHLSLILKPSERYFDRQALEMFKTDEWAHRVYHTEYSNIYFFLKNFEVNDKMPDELRLIRSLLASFSVNAFN